MDRERIQCYLILGHLCSPRSLTAERAIELVEEFLKSSYNIPCFTLEKCIRDWLEYNHFDLYIR